MNPTKENYVKFKQETEIAVGKLLGLRIGQIRRASDGLSSLRFSVVARLQKGSSTYSDRPIFVAYFVNYNWYFSLLYMDITETLSMVRPAGKKDRSEFALQTVKETNRIPENADRKPANESFLIHGRVVDSKNQPVSNARVTLTNASRNTDITQSVDGVTGVYSSDVNGNFEIVSSLGPGAQPVLYVTTPIPFEAYSPLTPPFQALAPINVNPGKAIKLNGKNDLNVGDVPIHVRFHSVVALLTGESPLSNPIDDDDRPEIWVRLRNARGDVASLGSVPSKAIRLNPFSIVLSLPEGRWTFDASFEGPDGPWYEVDQPLNIVSSQLDQIYVSLKSAPRDAGLQLTTPQEARERLARLGISYNEVSFSAAV